MLPVLLSFGAEITQFSILFMQKLNVCFIA